MLDDKMVAFLDEPLLCYVATRDGDNVPSGHRPFGHRVGRDRSHIRCLFDQRLMRNLRDNFERNGAAAIVLSHPLTFETYQYKGVIVEIGEADAEDLAAYEKWSLKATEALRTLQMPESAAAALLPPTLAVELKVEEIFHQTPGPGAGNKVEGES